MRHVVLIGLSVLALSYPMGAAAENDAEALMAPGLNVITGSAPKCAGKVVALLPATTANMTWIKAAYDWHGGPSGRGVRNNDASAQAPDAGREVTCDVRNTFRFDGVADGVFVVLAGRSARMVSPVGGKPATVALLPE